MVNKSRVDKTPRDHSESSREFRTSMKKIILT